MPTCAAAWRKKCARSCRIGAILWRPRANWPELRRELRRYRIGLAPVMLTRQPSALRRAAYRLAPRKILAYNSRLERHHLRPSLASFLFWRGVPLDRIYLRPWWWPWPKRERTVTPTGDRVLEGRPCSPERRRVAVLSPYFPYPLAHGGAVRIFNLLREAAREFDVELFAFTDDDAEPPAATVLEFCARVVLVTKPRYREPRWSTLLPPEVHEFRSPAMRNAIARERAAFGFEALQVEYTQLARYSGDALVEHDVTFDLFAQIARREHTLAAWWNWFRWRRFETRAVRAARRVVVMSPKDAEMLGPKTAATVIENGVDLARFQPAAETPGERLLFIGSFRHFPNVAAYRFFTERVWPLLRDKFPQMELTVVCGPDHSHLLARLRRNARARRGPAHPPAGIRCRRPPTLLRNQPRRRAHHRLRRHQRESSRSHGHAAVGGLDQFRVRRPGPAGSPQRLDRRHAGILRGSYRHPHRRPRPPRANRRRRLLACQTQLRLAGYRRKAARVVAGIAEGTGGLTDAFDQCHPSKPNPEPVAQSNERGSEGADLG